MAKLSLHILLIFCCFLSFSQIQQGKKYFSSDSSQISEIFHFSLKDSTLSGPYESFYQNGSLRIYGWYVNDLPDSIWTYYYENGQKKATGNFRKGKPKGNWTYFYENGNLKSQGKLEGEKKEGDWKFYYENHGEKSQGKYRGNKKFGIWNYFYEDGSLKAQAALKDDSGTYVEFYPSGKRKMEGQNLNNKSVGEWVYYFESGEVEAIGSFNNGLKEGPWKYFHKNGQPAGVGTYKAGERIGEWEFFHPNGQLSQSGQIMENQKDGYWKLYYPSGEVMGEISYEEGSGPYTEYYPSGNQKSKGNIKEGLKEGQWFYYSEKGQLEGEAFFENGRGSYTGYYPDGDIKMKGTLEGDKRVGEWTLFNPDGSIAGTYRPIYENQKPIFKTRITSDTEEKNLLDKPNYHPEKRGLRYFLPRVNEYKGFIVGSNPLWLLDNRLPVSFEYYIQERLGYELQIDIYRDPFFTSDSNISTYELSSRGLQLHFRQKFYHAESKFGMLYFGHQINLLYKNHDVSHLDTLIIQQPTLRGNLTETSYGYSLLLGNRWMKDVGNSGLTVDLFVGIGIGRRSYSKDYQPGTLSSILNDRLDPYFDPIIKSEVHFPIVFGCNIGYAITKSKSKTQ